MKSSIVLGCCLLIASQSIWANVYLRAPYSQQWQFEKVFNKRPQALRQRDILLNNHNMGKSDQLTSLLEQAQMDFLSPNRTNAIKAFKKVTEMALEADWNEVERQVIFYAFLRLAQLDDDQHLKWMQEAIHFDHQQSPEPEFFSPVFIEEFEKIREETIANFVQWNTTKKLGAFSKVMINGTVHSKGDLVKTSPGPVRVTFLSDAHHPISLQTVGENLSQIKVNPKALVGGNCQKPFWYKKPGSAKKYFVVFSDNCVREYSKGNWVPSLEKLTQSPSPTPPPIQQRWSPPKAESPWYKSPWIYVGLAAIAVGTTIHLNQQDKEGERKVKPNHY